ncbi:transcription termination/antitermination protein NusG [Pelagibacterium montanilacus]|uniref:transcription termination/antitermination protein NusG n=1 Tax=Pelagibacterium montanilacus TaxID=2185280 RepID=UPI000F8EFD9A|nr:hypothetical protein [Pelagibacterium montanilacus]
MPTLRHRTAIARIKADAHRLTKREREKLGLPAEPVRRADEPPAFPADPAGYAWFALTTLPRQEAAVARKLARMGYAAFNPVEIVKARSCRQMKYRRKARERAMLTSMVLAGFPGRTVVRHLPAHEVADQCGGRRMVAARERRTVVADVPWLSILDIPEVIGVVGIGGVPRPVPLGNILALHAADGRRGTTRNWQPVEGDIVELAHGPFAEIAGKIVELSEGKAKVVLFGKGLFAGKSAPIEVAESWLRLTANVDA